MSKIYKAGDIVYFNDCWASELGIEIEVLKIHKINEGQNSVYYYTTKRLDGKPMKRFIRYDCIFDTKTEAIVKGMNIMLKQMKEIEKRYYDNLYNNRTKGEN